MELRQLGSSSLQISPIVFGAWAIGGWMWGGSDEQDAIAAIHAAIDNGINMIDTAAIYGMGHSEELVAKAVEGRRDKVLIATKCGMRWDDPQERGTDPWPNNKPDGTAVTVRKNSHPDSILYECEQSLKRLKTDVIDLYQIHWPDTSTPVEESIRAMEKLLQQGKIRAIGVSNYDAEWLAKAQAVTPIASLQPPYSVLRRDIEQEIVPLCQKENIGIIVYSPMERGLLTGKVTPDRTFAEGDHRANHPLFTPENRRKVLDALEKLRPICERHDATFAQVIINWTFRQPGITAAIVGARDAKQVTQNAGALRFTLSDEELTQIADAFASISAGR